MLAQQLPLLDREKRHGKSPQFRVKGEHQCCKMCIETEQLGRFETVDVIQPKTSRNSPKNISVNMNKKAGQPASFGHFLPKLTDLNQQSEALLPQLEVKSRRINAPSLPKLTINTKPYSFKPAELDVLTNEETENDNMSQLLESQIGGLTKSRESISPRTLERAKESGANRSII